MAMRCTKEGSVDPYLGELELSVWYDAELLLASRIAIQRQPDLETSSRRRKCLARHCMYSHSSLRFTPAP